MRKSFLVTLLFLLPLFLWSQPNMGMRAMNFILTNHKGKEVSLSDYKGKIVLLDFWVHGVDLVVRKIQTL